MSSLPILKQTWEEIHTNQSTASSFLSEILQLVGGYDVIPFLPISFTISIFNLHFYTYLSVQGVPPRLDVQFTQNSVVEPSTVNINATEFLIEANDLGFIDGAHAGLNGGPLDFSAYEDFDFREAILLFTEDDFQTTIQEYHSFTVEEWFSALGGILSIINLVFLVNFANHDARSFQFRIIQLQNYCCASSSK